MQELNEMTDEQILEKGAESFRKQCLSFRQIHDIRTYQYGYLEATKELYEGIKNKKIKQLEELLAEQHPDLKQFLELANQRENELVEENKRLLDEVNGFRNVVKQNVKTVETLNDLIDVQDKKLTEANELKSEIELMKKVIIALAKITVTPGFNCTYPENNKFYNLVAKMKKT